MNLKAKASCVFSSKPSKDIRLAFGLLSVLMRVLEAWIQSVLHASKRMSYVTLHVST